MIALPALEASLKIIELPAALENPHVATSIALSAVDESVKVV